MNPVYNEIRYNGNEKTERRGYNRVSKNGRTKSVYLLDREDMLKEVSKLPPAERRRAFREMMKAYRENQRY